MDWVPALFLCLLSVKFRSERNPYQEAQTVVFVAWLFVVTFRKPVVKSYIELGIIFITASSSGFFQQRQMLEKKTPPIRF